MIGPCVDNIFDAVKIRVAPAGTVERVPKTDEDWSKIRTRAVTICGRASILEDSRGVHADRRSGTNSTARWTELRPAQIKAKLKRPPVCGREDQGCETGAIPGDCETRGRSTSCGTPAAIWTGVEACMSNMVSQGDKAVLRS